MKEIDYKAIKYNDEVKGNLSRNRNNKINFQKLLADISNKLSLSVMVNYK